MNTDTFELLVKDIHDLAYTSLDESNAYQARLSTVTLKVFLQDIIALGGFHAQVAATVRESMSLPGNRFVARCSDRQARLLAEAATRGGVRFVRPRI